MATTKKKSRRIMYNVVTYCRNCRTRMVSPRGQVKYHCGSCAPQRVAAQTN